MWNKLTRDRRVQILLLLIIGVLTRFWLTSRYPSLDTKSMMAGSVSLADGLSFDAWLSHNMADSAGRDIVITFLNWLHTNQQGMTFGLMIAILFMCLIPLLRDEIDRFISKRFSATLAGALLGAPLGVCVNCAAPIAFGMYKQGARMEAALATMISSPTMNVVVLSMAFTLFPVYIVAIKIFAALFVILVLIPLLVHRFPDEAVTREPLETTHLSAVEGVAEGAFYIERNTQAAVEWVTVTIVRQSWILLKQVVPIMLLAGLLGSVAVVLVPWDMLVGYLPQQVTVVSVVVMAALSAFGLFLPVPIAFDVVLAASLINAGVAVQYVAILLFVLGSFSIYSLFVLLKAGAKKTAWALVGALIVVGVLTGLATKLVHDFYDAEVQAPLFDQLSGAPQQAATDMPAGLSGGVYEDQFDANAAKTTSALHEQLGAVGRRRHLTENHRLNMRQDAVAPELAWQAVPGNPRMEQLQLLPQGETARRFSHVPLNQLGLHHHFKPLVFNFVNEFPDSNGVSGGDFNNDGWFDLLFATPNGVYIYMNTGGQFQLYTRLTGDHALAAFDSGAAAFVDLDNDHQPDVIFSEHGTGLWISYNRNGKFSKPIQLPDSDKRFTKSLAFFDLRGDGYLEFFAGNVSSMLALRPSHESSQNILYRRKADGSYAAANIREPFGETLSLWLSDIDTDGDLDLWVGNDFDEPDMFYELGGRTFKPVPPGKIEESTRWTMSIDAADVDNDLDMEVYLGQTTWNPSSPPYKIEQGQGIIAQHCKKFDGPYCRLSKALAQTRKATKRGDASLCEALSDDFRLDCVATVYFRSLRSSISPTTDKQALLAKAAVLKDKYPKLYENFLEMVAFDPITIAESNQRFARFTRQRAGINVFLVMDEQGNYKNKSVEYGVDIGGWTWNARFADVDSDEWQDLYVANGWTPSELETTNVLYRNNQGKGFTNVSAKIGLLDFEPTIAYTYIDYDNDGDLDIISYSQVGRVAVMRNDVHLHQSIQFELRDSKGNYYGVGAKLIIRYGDDAERHQIREIKMSGGHLSFDPKIAHFGLGAWERVDALEVQWSSGEKEVFSGPFKSGHRYKITR